MKEHTLVSTYYRLLTDVSMLSKVPLGSPDDIDMDWLLIKGPLLDKVILRFLELRELGDSLPGKTQLEKSLHEEFKELIVEILRTMPDWLFPLWEKFLVSGLEPMYLKYIRQVLCFCYKAETIPTNEQKLNAERQFFEAEEDIRIWNSAFSPDQGPYFSNARACISRVISTIDWQVIEPSHGPGAVFPPCDPSEKTNFTTIYAPIERYYNFYEYMVALPYWRGLHHRVKGASLIESDTIVCNLCYVPKDSRGPRLICVHPKEAIWIQQGQRRLLEDAVSKKLGKFIKFDDQTENQRLALESSLSKEYCTLDLKDASDRVSNKLVQYLFGDAYRYIGATRATHVRVNSRLFELEKFAPMGNCLTFPVESLVFYALVKSAIQCAHGYNRDHVYVFGDDILFPSKYYDSVVRGLSRAGLIPNSKKTFYRGSFRESCGVDAFRGVDVTPHRMKKWDVNTVSNQVSVCALAKNMRMDGYLATSAYMYSLVRKKGPLPLSNNPEIQGINEYVKGDFLFMLRNAEIRFNGNLHRYESRCLLTKGRTMRPKIDDWYHLQDAIGKHADSRIGDFGAMPLNRAFLNSLGLSKAERDMVIQANRRKTEDLSFHRVSGYPVPHRSRLQWGWTEVRLS